MGVGEEMVNMQENKSHNKSHCS